MGDVLKENYEKAFVNKFTGEVSRFKSSATHSVSAGFVNKGKDLCRASDYVPVRDIIARFTRAGNTLSDLARETELQYLHSDDDQLSIDDDTLEDNVELDGDLMDRQLDLEDYVGRLAVAGNSKPVTGNTTTAENQAQFVSEQGQMSADAGQANEAE